MLPTELLHDIIQRYFHSLPPRDTETSGRSYKAAWDAVEPLTLSSKTLRQLALEAWFEVFFCASQEDIGRAWPEMSLWTRELHCVELDADLKALPVRWDLRPFSRLRKLRVDLNRSVSNALLPLRFDHPRHIASQLQELEVHDCSWPSPMLLRVVSEAFMGLLVLKLAQDLVWCDLCYTCQFATFRDHPPEKVVYEKGVGLPDHYNMYLTPLQRLHTVHLTIGYGLGGSVSISDGNADLWMGECDACMDMMYPSDEWRADWVGRKRAMKGPPALRFVEWHFRQREVADVVMEFDDDLESSP